MGNCCKLLLRTGIYILEKTMYSEDENNISAETKIIGIYLTYKDASNAMVKDVKDLYNDIFEFIVEKDRNGELQVYKKGYERIADYEITEKYILTTEDIERIDKIQEELERYKERYGEP